MKKTLAVFTACACAIIASAVYAQSATTAPAAKLAAPAVTAPTPAAPVAKPTTTSTGTLDEKVSVAPATIPTTVGAQKLAADPKAQATDVCKKKGLVGQALDECVKNEVAKLEAPKAPEAAPTVQAMKPLETTKAPAAPAPTAVPAPAAKAPAAAPAPSAPAAKPSVQ